jgi:hypothetical protein
LEIAIAIPVAVTGTNGEEVGMCRFMDSLSGIETSAV